MGKLTIVTCDRCGQPDTQESRALRTVVCGAGIELCVPCRVHVLHEAGVKEELAEAYVVAHDQHEGMGPKPSLARVLEQLEAEQEAIQLGVPTEGVIEEPALDAPASTTDDEPDAPEVKGRRAKATSH